MEAKRISKKTLTASSIKFHYLEINSVNLTFYYCSGMLVVNSAVSPSSSEVASEKLRTVFPKIPSFCEFRLELPKWEAGNLNRRKWEAVVIWRKWQRESGAHMRLKMAFPVKNYPPGCCWLRKLFRASPRLLRIATAPFGEVKPFTPGIHRAPSISLTEAWPYIFLLF